MVELEEFFRRKRKPRPPARVSRPVPRKSNELGSGTIEPTFVTTMVPVPPVNEPSSKPSLGVKLLAKWFVSVVNASVPGVEEDGGTSANKLVT